MPVAKFGATVFCGALAVASVCLASNEPVNAAPRGGGCEAARAITLIGKPAPSDSKLREATGAKVIRRAGKGQPVTLDYRPERLTIEVDKDRVVSVNCG